MLDEDPEWSEGSARNRSVRAMAEPPRHAEPQRKNRCTQPDEWRHDRGDHNVLDHVREQQLVIHGRKRRADRRP
jgi:hypothetical protein